MTVLLQIENVPEDIAQKLYLLAVSHHQTVQQEILTILEEAVKSSTQMTPHQLLTQVQQMGLKTADDSVGYLRELRNAR